ncbi:hypothetical protein [Epilithonimonas arachidiradicis]|uniref:Uncharacterized protein n=1 Tax=Epilithonimonas arachidiradicis TaxID=1617282 RepID=A0A420CMZ8_9FLAO|nr:hypothetical protein [Epilithonimonas arachidiradicis]RKE79778.1 hypothetical protein BXY58_3151 [Epilithonimonas arachidiradicis]GGG51828.1 hypothetical protein GCM10007332_11880 [Epilithonimonas arachidiradicis]
MKIIKTIEVYERDVINPAKTYNIKFVKEFDISIIEINELKKLLLLKKMMTIYIYHIH